MQACGASVNIPWKPPVSESFFDPYLALRFSSRYEPLSPEVHLDTNIWSEADTRSKLIDPAIHSCGWTEDLIRREETAGSITISGGQASKHPRGRVDYVLRVKVHSEAQPVAVALIEAKAAHLPPAHGLEQGKLYSHCKRMNVPFVFSTNGYQFIEYDRITGLTTEPRLLAYFPTPSDIRARYERTLGFNLGDPAARPLLARYPGGEATRRYYQDAAIRAVLEKLAAGGKRALLSLATGSGKTFIAVNLLRKISDAGMLKRALFVCDRDELRSQALAAFQNVFGADACEVRTDESGANKARNARVHIATYQTLGIDTEEGDATLLTRFYPEDYFSHIVIDECHRSAWGKWSEVLRCNPNAVQIGLTATPRRLRDELEKAVGEGAPLEEDLGITADNLKHFGDAVYEYDMAQGIEDGYLAACEISKIKITIDGKLEDEDLALSKDDLYGKDLFDAITGKAIAGSGADRIYTAYNFEKDLLLPDRVRSMCQDLFGRFLATGGPEQKTIIFCVRDMHADAVASELNNLYADWCAGQGIPIAEDYAFKCTAASGGGNYLSELRGSMRHHFIATTVDLLTTGVDVPCVENIVFFRYVKSAIAFYQMVGRGTRLNPTTDKLMFRVYDYTNATSLFGRGGEPTVVSSRKITDPWPPPPPPPIIQVEGFDVHISPAGRYIVTSVDGKAMPVTLEEYRERLARKLVEEAPTLESFRDRWITPARRRSLLEDLPDGGRSALVIQQLDEMTAFDLYDVLAELGYGLNPRTREERAEAFFYKHREWLEKLPDPAEETLRAITRQFARGGTDALENPAVLETPEVQSAGGLPALKELGKPSEILVETKKRIFAA